MWEDSSSGTCPRHRTTRGPHRAPDGHRGNEEQIFAPGEITVPGTSVSRISLTPDGKTAFLRHLFRHRCVRVARWSDAYFSSDRPVEAGGAIKDDFDMWAVRLTDRGYGPAHHLGPEVNTPTYSELYPTITRDGTLYFNSDRPGGIGAWDIYSARRCGSGYEAPEHLGPGVNTVDWEYNPSLTPDGDTLVFASNRPTGQLSDLYAAGRERGKFAPAWNLGPLVNTAADEYHPMLRADQNRLYFVRQDVNPPGDSQFYVADARCVLQLR